MILQLEKAPCRLTLNINPVKDLDPAQSEKLKTLLENLPEYEPPRPSKRLSIRYMQKPKKQAPSTNDRNIHTEIVRSVASELQYLKDAVSDLTRRKEYSKVMRIKSEEQLGRGLDRTILNLRSSLKRTRMDIAELREAEQNFDQARKGIESQGTRKLILHSMPNHYLRLAEGGKAGGQQTRDFFAEGIKRKVSFARQLRRMK